jgi:HlyD family type I secretion membrane fusion protein
MLGFSYLQPRTFLAAGANGAWTSKRRRLPGNPALGVMRERNSPDDLAFDRPEPADGGREASAIPLARVARARASLRGLAEALEEGRGEVGLDAFSQLEPGAASARAVLDSKPREFFTPDYTPPPKPAKAPVRARRRLDAPLWWGAFVTLVGVGGFLLWAAFAPLDEGIVTQGVVTLEHHRQSIQHLRGGIVKEIRVRNGDPVHAGDALIRLDETQALAEMSLVKGQYLSTRATEARLLAERDRGAVLTFPEEVTREAGDPRIADFLRVQTELFETRAKSLAGEIAVARENMAGLQEQLGGLRELEQSKARQMRLYEEQLNSMRALLEKGYVARTQLFDLERMLAGVSGSRGEDLGNIARLQKNISELKLRVLNIEQQHLKDVGTQLQDVQKEAASLRERMSAAADALERMVATAPVDGYVMGLNAHTVGGVILPGQEIMSIVPLGEPFMLDVRIQPKDVDKIRAGLPAGIRLTAFNRNTTPVVQGRVTGVSPDRLQDERTGEPYYSSRVVLGEEGLAQLRDLQIQPGMPADVIIRTGERTLLEYLCKPLLDRFARSLKEE